MGFEAESRFHIDRLLGIYSHDFNIGAQLDYTHARDTTNNNYLPRIPPLKTILSATYGWKDMFSSSIEGVFVAAQRNIGEGELPTDAYQMLNANIDFTFPYLIEKNCMIYARAINLTNEEARVHSSFIKDFAPLPGRSFLMGVRGTF
jgi:iron complex outermembrane receptor protein